MNWYVLFIRSGMEEKIRDFFLSQGLQAFIPKMKVVFRKQGISELVEKTMFPGYLFIESGLGQVEMDERIKELRQQKTGIVKLLKFDKEGTPALRSEEKEYLERLLGKNKVLEHSTGLIQGNQVIITEGPLQGFESQIVKIDRHKRRAVLELELCGQPTRVSVSLEIVQKID